MSDVHPLAALGFSRTAAAYDRGRPEYPAAALAWLGERLDLRAGRDVLDLAAGTGKLTRPLAATGASVVAVEPLDAMRAAIGPPARAVAGTAEAIPLPDGAVDAVTVGQAFHWFDHARALAEIHRVLRPGGALAIVWNTRRREDPLQAAIDELIGPYRGTVPAHADQAWRAPLERSGLFGAVEERAFENEQRLDAQGLEDRVGSISFVASLDEPERGHVLARIRALAGAGTVSLAYRTEVQVVARVP